MPRRAGGGAGRPHRRGRGLAGWREEPAAEKQSWADELREVRTAPSFPYEPAYLAALLRELLPTETVLVTPDAPDYRFGPLGRKTTSWRP